MSLCGGSLRGTAWGPRSFFHRLNLCWFLQPEVVGTYLPGTGTLGWGAWCGAGTPCSWDIPPKFLSTTCGCGTSPFHVCAPSTSLDGCGFFNSTGVRLPFNSISGSAEWWLFYILVIILMLLCEEASHVYLCCHLDQMSNIHRFYCTHPILFLCDPLSIFTFHIIHCLSIKVVNFCILILYPVILLNLTINSRLFCRFLRIFYIQEYTFARR